MNLITDVSVVRFGHVTISRRDIQTGVTAVLPYDGNLFRGKLVAASHVINGFGKSIGLIQINEMGTLKPRSFSPTPWASERRQMS